MGILFFLCDLCWRQQPSKAYKFSAVKKKGIINQSLTGISEADGVRAEYCLLAFCFRREPRLSLVTCKKEAVRKKKKETERETPSKSIYLNGSTYFCSAVITITKWLLFTRFWQWDVAEGLRLRVNFCALFMFLWIQKQKRTKGEQRGGSVFSDRSR